MGTDMSLLLSEHEVAVSLFEVSQKNIKNASEKFSSEADGKTNMQFFTGDYGHFVASLNPGPRFFLLSITHGNPVDQVLDALTPHLQQGDVILDGGNEWCKYTEHQQKQLRNSELHSSDAVCPAGISPLVVGPACLPVAITQF
jgi:6-phosphogluconate dehydrogenase